ncbi:hypothetical protein [Corallococcus exercitus]|uniref:hypothetical protein n=1 Tax=Corallococcus exercitus TaxID=2316736 RepID=UPI001ABF7891|nr:hypothetical protein [Corallococcus exercitus]
MREAREAVMRAEAGAHLLPGATERFSGWGLMGLPFRSGDILATRRFPASSIGPGYTSVWHRAPDGVWTFYADVSPATACTRYFGEAVERAVVSPIELVWTAEDTLVVRVPEARLRAEVVVGNTLASRALNLMAAGLPEWAWRNPSVLERMSHVAGPLLHAGRLAMAGEAPNHQRFIANPRKVWVVKSARLVVGERVATDVGPVTPQARLGDFYIPQRGLLAVGNAAFDALDPAHHSTSVCRGLRAAEAH